MTKSKGKRKFNETISNSRNVDIEDNKRRKLMKSDKSYKSNESNKSNKSNKSDEFNTFKILKNNNLCSYESDCNICIGFDTLSLLKWINYNILQILDLICCAYINQLYIECLGKIYDFGGIKQIIFCYSLNINAVQMDINQEFISKHIEYVKSSSLIINNFDINTSNEYHSIVSVDKILNGQKWVFVLNDIEFDKFSDIAPELAIGLIPQNTINKNKQNELITNLLDTHGLGFNLCFADNNMSILYYYNLHQNVSKESLDGEIIWNSKQSHNSFGILSNGKCLKCIFNGNIYEKYNVSIDDTKSYYLYISMKNNIKLKIPSIKFNINCNKIECFKYQ